MKISPLAGEQSQPAMLVNVPRLVTANNITTASRHSISFGASGHSGSAFENSFSEGHVLALSQAIFVYRKRHDIAAPVSMYRHARDFPTGAYRCTRSAAANDLDVMIEDKDEYTPTPVIFLAIVADNCRPDKGLAEGNVIVPLHNSPHNGGSDSKKDQSSELKLIANGLALPIGMIGRGNVS